MSTTFAIKTYNPLKYTPVAHRFSLGNGKVGITWLTKKQYPDAKRVVPIDNTVQGVETIGDLRKLADVDKIQFKDNKSKNEFKLRSCIHDLDYVKDELTKEKKEMINSIKNDLKFVLKNLDKK